MTAHPLRTGCPGRKHTWDGSSKAPSSGLVTDHRWFSREGLTIGVSWTQRGELGESQRATYKGPARKPVGTERTSVDLVQTFVLNDFADVAAMKFSC